MELTYFPVDGIAAPIRFTCALGNIAFEDKMVNGDRFFSDPTYKAELKFRTVPILKDGDVTIGQSQSILRYVGRKANMYPQEIAHEIDDLIECIVEYESRVRAGTYGGSSWGLNIVMDDDQMIAFKQKVKEDIVDMKIFPCLNNHLEKSTTGFVFNTPKPTIADCYVASFIANALNYKNMSEEDLAKHPKVQAFHKMFFAQEVISTYKAAFAKKFAAEISIMSRMKYNKETKKYELQD